MALEYFNITVILELWICQGNVNIQQSSVHNIFNLISKRYYNAVSGKLSPRKIAPRLGFDLVLGLELGLGAIFNGISCPGTS